MLERLSHIMIYSANHKNSVDWYCKKLGFEIDYNAPGEYASLHHEKLGRLAIHATDTNEHNGKGPLPYFLCNDIKKTISTLRERGIKVSDPEREGESPWFCDFRDPDGNIWGIEEK